MVTADGDTVDTIGCVEMCRLSTSPTPPLDQIGASVSGHGQSRTATTVVRTTTPEAEVDISIDFEDDAGNYGHIVISATDDSIVTVDRTVPALESLDISSYNVNSATLTADADNSSSKHAALKMMTVLLLLSADAH